MPMIQIIKFANKGEVVQWEISRTGYNGNRQTDWRKIKGSNTETFLVKSGKSLDAHLTEIRAGDLYLCLEHRLVTVHNQEIALTVKEFDILALLIMNPKHVFTYELIADLVWNEDYSYFSRKAINNHVSNLRKKLKIRPGDPNYIKTVIGIGYKFTLP